VNDQWQKITWGEARKKVRQIATTLLKYDLSPEKPLGILSENSIESALLILAAMHVGVPVVPISTSYALISKDFSRLENVFRLMTPKLVYISDGECFADSIKALDGFDFELIIGKNRDAIKRQAIQFEDLLQSENKELVDDAFAKVTPETIAKFLLTSGSTGEPKAVINTQKMLCSNQKSLALCWKFLEKEPPVLVDWLPWHHTFGGNNNFGMVLTHGGTLYIDDGKPTPQLIEKTIRNLKEISPTIYLNAPRGYGLLLPYLEADKQLRKSFFKNLRMINYASAALSEDIWQRLEKLSIEETGRITPISSGWGATETAPQVTLGHFLPNSPRVIGLPSPGIHLKMIPTHTKGKFELRVNGPNVMPGYWRRPELNAEVFDDEGFYKIGDTGCFADEENPACGIEFAGRISEEFKLSTGTWVHVGALRVKALTVLSPVAQDIVITGLNRNEIGFLIFPNEAGCQSICGENSTKHPQIIEHILNGLRQLKRDGKGSSSYATRVMFLTEPPKIDAGEITDKGYINQRMVLELRAAEVEKLYSETDEIIRL
jgi:feruloyl-CoA synthase